MKFDWSSFGGFFEFILKLLENSFNHTTNDKLRGVGARSEQNHRALGLGRFAIAFFNWVELLKVKARSMSELMSATLSESNSSFMTCFNSASFAANRLPVTFGRSSALRCKRAVAAKSTRFTGSSQWRHVNEANVAESGIANPDLCNFLHKTTRVRGEVLLTSASNRSSFFWSHEARPLLDVSFLHVSLLSTS